MHISWQQILCFLSCEKCLYERTFLLDMGFWVDGSFPSIFLKILFHCVLHSLWWVTHLFSESLFICSSCFQDFIYSLVFWVWLWCVWVWLSSYLFCWRFAEFLESKFMPLTKFGKSSAIILGKKLVLQSLSSSSDNPLTCILELLILFQGHQGSVLFCSNIFSSQIG